MFSPAQQGKYRPLVQRAWIAHCLRTGLNPDVDSAHETWYRQQLMDACGIYTTKQASPTKDFDRVMGHFAAIAGDEVWVRRTAEGDERRLRYLIRREIERGTVTEPYVLAIARNMGLLPAPSPTLDAPRSTLDDLPADHLWRIWNALLRHNARHGKPEVSGQRSEVGGSRAAARRGRSPRVNAPLPF